uniref:Uncharacterized protein n=1 Tax=Picea glauca TaxID=3330 RepID=A0A101M076_PICGL|nr:hypothetical protein ABT39_MTgene4567 [Picea glauca]
MRMLILYDIKECPQARKEYKQACTQATEEDPQGSYQTGFQ